MLQGIIQLSVLYFFAVGVLSVIAWMISPKFGSQLLKGGAIAYVLVAKFIAKWLVLVGVRIARYVWSLTQKYVLPRVKVIALRAFAVIKNTLTKVGN